MAKIPFQIAVGFAPQTAEGTYNPVLAALTNNFSGTSALDEGLMLGTVAGIGDSGITYQHGRDFQEAPVVGGSAGTRSLSAFLRHEVSSFTFACPWVGNRAIAAGPTDSQLEPGTGMTALLQGLGLVGGAWIAGDGFSFTPSASQFPFSALLFYSGTRHELLDCRSSVSIDMTPGQIPVATWTIEVGSFNEDPILATFPTLFYGDQATVAPAKLSSAEFLWNPGVVPSPPTTQGGFSALTLDINTGITTVPDSNAADGIGKALDPTARETKVTTSIYADSSDALYFANQILETDAGNIDPMSWQVGVPTAAGGRALGIQHIIPTPETRTDAFNIAGSSALDDVELIAKSATADGELEIIFF